MKPLELDSAQAAKSDSQPDSFAVSSLFIDAEPARGPARVAEARRLARDLEKENMAWVAPFAAILLAGAASVEGDTGGAATFLRSAIERAEAADMSGYASAARHQLGVLLGGSEEGEVLVAGARAAMAEQGICVPDRFASTLVPGRWRVWRG